MPQKRGETKRKWVQENFRLPPLSNRTLRVFLGGIEEKGFFIGSGSKKTESSGLPLPSVYPRIHCVFSPNSCTNLAPPFKPFFLRLFLFSDTNLPLAANHSVKPNRAKNSWADRHLLLLLLSPFFPPLLFLVPKNKTSLGAISWAQKGIPQRVLGSGEKGAVCFNARRKEEAEAVEGGRR